MEAPAGKRAKIDVAKKLRVLPICSEGCLAMAKSLPTNVSSSYYVGYTFYRIVRAHRRV